MHDKEFDQTLVLIKPDAMKNSLTGYILSQLSEYHAGLVFAGSKVVKMNAMLAEEHYAEHKGKGFFPSLLEYISGRIHFAEAPHKQRLIAIVYQGPQAVEKVRAIAGPTNPHNARVSHPGCIRSLGTVVPVKDAAGNPVGDRIENMIHASANAADAEREIKLWFKPIEIPVLMRIYETAKSDILCFYKEGKVLSAYEAGAICLFAPGDTVWASDLKIVKQYLSGEKADNTLELVAAKYLINEN